MSFLFIGPSTDAILDLGQGRLTNSSTITWVSDTNANTVIGNVANDSAIWNANRLQGINISSATPADGQALIYNQANNQWEFGAAGGGTPAGNNGEIQFNDNGAFGSDSAFTYDNINRILNVNKISNISSIVGLNNATIENFANFKRNGLFYFSFSTVDARPRVILGASASVLYTASTGHSIHEEMAASVVTTTDATPTSIFQLPTTYRINNTPFVIEASVAGKRTDVTGTYSFYKIVGFVKYTTGVGYTVISQSKLLFHEDDPNTDVQIVSLGQDLVIQVIGIAGQTWKWTGKVNWTANWPA